VRRKFRWSTAWVDHLLIGFPRRLVGLVILVGLGGGIAGAAYLLVIHVLQHALWPTEWSGVIGFAILGGVGLFAGLVTRFVGSPGDVELMVDNIHVSGTATGIRELRALIPISWLCISSGGAMGPEAPLVQTTGSLASALAKRCRLDARESRVLTITGMAAGFTVLFGAPLGSAIFALEILHRRGLEYYEALIPSVLGSLAGYAIYVLATSAGLAPVWHIPAPASIHIADLGWALLAGVAGAVIAALFSYGSALLRRVARRLRSELRPVVGGLLLAALGLASAYSLTYGEAQINQILRKPSGAIAVFALAGLAKLAGTSVTFASEWRGGFIIPLFFMGVCAARALHGVFPSSNEAVMIGALMVAANVGVTKTPIGSTLVVTEMGGLRLLPTTLLAAMVSMMLTSEVGLIQTQRERDVIGEE
jgi:H+/Cl- antiporter ClcA